MNIEAPTLNCNETIPIQRKIPAIADITLTYLPYKFPRASAIERFPKNSPIRGIKKYAMIIRHKGSPIAGIIKYNPCLYDSVIAPEKNPPPMQVAITVAATVPVENFLSPTAYSLKDVFPLE